MNRKNLIELFVLGLWLIIGLVFFVYQNKSNNTFVPLPDKLNIPSISDSKKNKQFSVKKIIVLSGDAFDITLKDKDGTRILCKLSANATEDAKKKVYDLLNDCTNPQVVLLDKQSDGRWIVKLKFNYLQKEVNLPDWLLDNNLAYK